MKSFLVQFVYQGLGFPKFYDIDSDQANNDFLSNKLLLESVSDEKKKIEVNAQFKKARARLL